MPKSGKKIFFWTSMGSPLSAGIANLVIEDFEQVSLKKLNCHVEFYNQYAGII